MLLHLNPVKARRVREIQAALQQAPRSRATMTSAAAAAAAAAASDGSLEGLESERDQLVVRLLLFFCFVFFCFVCSFLRYLSSVRVCVCLSVG